MSSMAIGRPRTTSDEQILAGTARAIARVGPARLTLAEVGREVGLTPATLLQRFGSKRGLMLALVRHSAATAAASFPPATALAGGALRGLVGAMTAMTEGLTPEAMSNHLAFLQLDLADVEFRRLAGEHARAIRHQIQTCLSVAVDQGELPAQDIERLARSVQVAYNGALLLWALDPEGLIGDWVGEEIRAVLAAALPEAPGQAPLAPSPIPWPGPPGPRPHPSPKR